MHQKPIATIMSRFPCSVAAQASVQYVVNLMNRRRQSCVVVTEGDRPLGVVTERDIVRMLARVDVDISQLLVNQIMTSPAVTLNAQDSIASALILAHARKLRHLVIVNDQRKLVGVVALSDMVRAYIDDINRIEQTVAAEVEERTRDLQKTNRKLLNLALEDGLMGIGNRRAMEIDLDHTQSGAKRYGDTYQVALMDIDYFKRFNDTYGHQRGDEVLQKIAQVLTQQLRESDRLYRYGGEELLLLMPKVDIEQAYAIADRARQAIQEEEIEHSGSELGVLTISAGVASGDPEDWSTCIQQADKALYQAKSQGRNRVVAAEPLPE